MDFYSRYNSWTPEFGEQVKVEYERFLELRAANSKLSPSDTIDKLWHVHILDTKSYIRYCMGKFNKYIHHDPADSVDQMARRIRLADTKAAYSMRFGQFVHPVVWDEHANLNYSTNSTKKERDLSIFSSWPPKVTFPIGSSKPIDPFLVINFEPDTAFNKIKLPDYKSISAQIPPNSIGVLITRRLGLFPDEKLPMENQIIQIPIDKQTKFSDIKKIITDKTKLNQLVKSDYMSIAIKLSPHPGYVPKPKLPEKRVFGSSYGGLLSHNSLPSGDYFSYEDYDRVKLDTNIISNSSTPDCKLYIADIHEMTSNGYC